MFESEVALHQTQKNNYQRSKRLMLSAPLWHGVATNLGKLRQRRLEGDWVWQGQTCTTLQVLSQPRQLGSLAVPKRGLAASLRLVLKDRIQYNICIRR